MTSSQYALGDPATDRRYELLKIIDMEIAEIVRIGRAVSSNPKHLIHLAELNLEKARHFKDLENEKFLKMPLAKTKNINRKHFFKKSRKYVSKAEAYCRTIMKRFPKYPYKGDVYYIMAFNAKEFGRYTKAQQYFLLASKYRSTDPNVKLKAHIALADIFYNQSKFRKAVKHYEIGLHKKIDQWWTKDAYNLAWCYYQVGKYNKGIKQLRQVIKRSSSKKYVNMADQASRDLARFYVQAGRITEAVRYYKKTFSKPGKKLTELGEYLIGQSKYTKAIPILEEAKRMSNRDANLEKRVNFALLKGYGKFGKYKKQLAISQSLMSVFNSKQMSVSEQKIFKYHVTRSFAVAQTRVAGKMYKSRPKQRLALARVVAEFAKLMKKIEPRKEIAYSYLTAEAFYQSKDYKTAATHYREALSLSKRVGNKRYIKLSLDGVAACLGHSKNSKDKVELLAVYSGYLALNPRNKKAHTIYQRLFALQMDDKDLSAAEKTLDTFRKNFKKDEKRSEAMLAKIMDYHLKKEDKVNFNRLYKKVSSGTIPVGPKYAKRLKKIALSLQFQDVQKASSEGQKKRALVLYVNIYRDKNSNAEAKKTSAYNIMRMFYLLGDSKRMYQWADRALSHMNKRDVLKFQVSFSKLAFDLFERRHFDYSYLIYEKVYNRLCGTSSTLVEDGFNNMNVILLSKSTLVAGDKSKINKLLSRARKCGVKKRIVNQVRIDLLKRYLDDHSWYEAYGQFRILSKTRSNWNNLIAPAYTLSQNLSKKRLKKQVSKLYNYSIKVGAPVDINAANSIYQIRRGAFDWQVKQFNKIKLRFPEKRFNSTLEKKFKLLTIMMTKGVKLINLGSSEGVVDVYQTLIRSYETLINSIKNFTPPKRSAAFVKSFKNSMKGVVQALEIKKVQLYKDSHQLIIKHDILHPENFFFTPDVDRSIQYNSIYSGLIMDRGGIR